MSTTQDIGFGLIGAGNIAAVHAAAIAGLPGVRLRAVLGATAARAEALARAHGAEAFTDEAAFLARPDIDVVTICTPSGTHAAIGARAAAAGKHVVVEKPIDVTLEAARRLIDACATAGVRLAVIFQSRFLPAVRLIDQALERGRLGRLYQVDGYVKWYRAPEYYQAARWRGTRALDGGGALINQAIHTVDLVQHFGGPVASVFGQTARLRHPGIEGEDTAVATLRFASGALGVLQASTSIAPGFSRRVELHGEKGSVILDGNDIALWRLDGGPGDEERALERLRAGAKDASDGASNPMNLDVDCHRRQLADFVEAMRAGRPPLIDGAEGCKALAIVLGVYRSAATGQPVSLPL